MHMQREGNMKLFSKAPFAVLLMLLPASGMTTGAFAGEKQYGLALLWQIFSGTGFPNQFFNDSWVVGFWRADH